MSQTETQKWLKRTSTKRLNFVLIQLRHKIEKGESQLKSATNSHEIFVLTALKKGSKQAIFDIECELTKRNKVLVND